MKDEEDRTAILEHLIRTELGTEFGVLDVVDAGERRGKLVELLHLYLSDEHGHADGWVLPSLTAEVAGTDDQVCELYQLRISRVVALVAPAMPGDAEQRKQRAWTVVAAIVGAVSLARAMPDGAHGRAVREATLKSVEAMITQP
ncbi:hypothetical protein ACIRG5_04050 [Lentzea sp. NPDC102401]|uniref:hypothetical protein n=1 Tax=Lentzea sp. NPDC102401 TaxID=3364128 RepID=UPI0037FA513E